MGDVVPQVEQAACGGDDGAGRGIGQLKGSLDQTGKRCRCKGSVTAYLSAFRANNKIEHLVYTESVQLQESLGRGSEMDVSRMVPVVEYTVENGQPRRLAILDRDGYDRANAVFARVWKGHILYVGTAQHGLRIRITDHFQRLRRPRTDNAVAFQKWAEGRKIVIYADWPDDADGKPAYRSVCKRLKQKFKPPFNGRLDSPKFVIPAAEDVTSFDPKDIEDGREKIMASIHRRQGQGSFRAAVLAAYSRRCAVTGCMVEAVLEAAHIVPYRGPVTNHVSNGLLLRADLHTLFDLGLIAVDTSSMSILTAPALVGTEYAELAGRKLSLPSSPGQRPNEEALDMHRREVFQGGAVEPA